MFRGRVVGPTQTVHGYTSVLIGLGDVSPRNFPEYTFLPVHVTWPVSFSSFTIRNKSNNNNNNYLRVGYPMNLLVILPASRSL